MVMRLTSIMAINAETVSTNKCPWCRCSLYRGETGYRCIEFSTKGSLDWFQLQVNQPSTLDMEWLIKDQAPHHSPSAATAMRITRREIFRGGTRSRCGMMHLAPAMHTLQASGGNSGDPAIAPLAIR